MLKLKRKALKLDNVLAAKSLSANCASSVSISTAMLKIALERRSKDSMLVCWKE
jgi:hypothetical protein